MIRKLMLVAAVALVLPNAVNAQDVTVTATVSPTFSLGGAGDLAFGALSPTVDNTIDATSGATMRTLDYNHNVTVTFNAPGVLTAPGLTNLPVTLMCASQLGGVWSAEQLCSSASIDLDVGPALTQATLGFGGTIAAADVAAAAAGDYTGSFDITVTAR
jgi:hypothetical protein